ncbi:MAG TPA: O-antigen ligase family protein [Sumerlaeia bacterium]|nr:O-antigen ligase family protein [Sumerlaeia bacterium]
MSALAKKQSLILAGFLSLASLAVLLSHPLGGAFLAGALAFLLALLVVPVDYRAGVFCFVGACFISGLKPVVPNEFLLLAFDLLLYGFVFFVALDRLVRGEALFGGPGAGAIRLSAFLALAFFLISLLEILNPNVPDLEFALRGFRKTAFTIVGFFAALWLFRTPSDLRAAWKALGFAGLPVCAYGVKQVFFFSSYDRRMLDIMRADVYTMQFEGFRAFSILSGPFHLGMFGCVVAVIALYFMREGRKSFWAVLYALAFACVVAAKTRTNLLVFFVASLLYVFLTTDSAVRLIRNWTLVALFLIPLLLVGYVARIEGFERLIVSIARMHEDERLLRRFETYPAIWQAIVDRPFLGYGMGSAGDTLETELGLVHFTTHNLLFKVLIETGVLGALSFFGLLIASLCLYSRIRWNRKRSPDTHRLAALHLGVIVVVLMNGLVGSGIEAYPVNLFFWFAVGGIVSLGRWTPDREERSAARNRQPRENGMQPL